MDPSIYKQLDYTVLMENDLVERLWSLLSNGNHRIDPITGKVMANFTTAVANPPWVYTRPRPELNCGFWHSILFDVGKCFPRACLDCWKVVVRPRTVEELIKLLVLQLDHTERYCKCGIEKRDYVEASYGGYFYCKGKEEGLQVLDEVRALVAEHINPDVDVYLKRYCTEYEVTFGPTDRIEERLKSGEEFKNDYGIKHCLKDNDKWVQRISEVVDDSYDEMQQPSWIRGHVIREWLEFAESRGDLTCRKFNEGKPCKKLPYMGTVRYEREETK